MNTWKFVGKFIGLSSTGKSVKVQSDQPELEGMTFNANTETPAVQQVLGSSDLTGYAYGVVTVMGQPTTLNIPGVDGIAYGINVVEVVPLTLAEYTAKMGITEVSLTEAIEGLAKNARPSELRGFAPTIAPNVRPMSGYERAAARAGYAEAGRALLS